ncbi:MAG TPA: hypothetical protein VNO33_15815 [Kofleriaceae bacterium]|nr:hypothetical protein [Kofleriaceae bacterium]
MTSAACTHPQAHIGQRVCRHLFGGHANSYAHRFTGTGRDYDLLCSACAEHDELVGVDMVTVCAECFEAAAARATWARGERAVLSSPVVAERATRLSFSHQMIHLPVALGASLLDLQPLLSSARSRWLAVTSAGALVALDLETRSWKRVADLAAAVDLDRDLALSVSPDGQMAAVVESRGQSGVVVDLAAGDITMLLERGADQVEGARFPVAFARRADRLLLVHGTDWNRLDAFDPRTGELVTPRPAGGLAAHAIDYVCSGLSVSPDGEWLVDNGFTPEAAGIPAAFRLGGWLVQNPWEAEDGPSRRYLCQRWDYWDGPMCWIDECTIALWGYGPDRLSLRPAVILFDVESGEAVRWFPGPRGPLVYDQHLFSLGDGDGMSVWDIQTGERLLHDAGFHPLRYHPGTRQFLTTNPEGELFVLSRLVGEP